MFGSGFKVRVTGLREEEDHLVADLWIEEKLGVDRPYTKEEYRAACREAPRPLKLYANLAIFNGEGEHVGSMELNVTDRRNVVFVGLEVSFEWI